MPHKSKDFRISTIEYYLDSNKTQDEVCNIFKCSVRSLMRWVLSKNINSNNLYFLELKIKIV